MAKIPRFFLLLFFILAHACLLYAQDANIRFVHLSTADGLSQVSVYSILQDKRGFMWFGTQGGLNRFDGYNMKEYKYDPKNPYSLSLNRVRTIYEDSSGNLWIGTQGGGVSLFSRDKERFVRYRYENESDCSPDGGIDIIATIYEDRSKVFWFGTVGGGLLRFDPAKKRWSRFVNRPGIDWSLSSNQIKAFCEDRTGIMWVGTEGGGLNAFDRDKKKFSRFLHDPADPDSLSSNNVFSLLSDKRGNLWVGTEEGLDKYISEENRFIHYRHDPHNQSSLSSNVVMAILEDSKGAFWVGTRDGGLNYLKSPDGKKFFHYINQQANRTSLSHNSIRSITEDDAGSIWIGTWGGGINRIVPQKQQFTNFSSSPKGLNSSNVYSLHEDRANFLWIGTAGGGLQRYHPNEGFKTYKFSRTDANSLSSNEIMAIHEDKKGDMWIGTWGGGLNRFDRETGKFFRYKYQPGSNKGPSDNHILSLCGDSKDNIWVGTREGGLNLFDVKKKAFVYFKNNPQDPDSISCNFIYVVYPDRLDLKILWVGTYRYGLERFNMDTGTCRHYKNVPGSQNCLSNNSISALYISPVEKDILWIGTFDGGLNMFNQKTNKWVFYTEADGLSNNSINGILEGTTNNLWISTDKGLSMFNPESKIFQKYFEEDGLQSNEFCIGAFHKNKAGRLYFGGINGFDAFYPEKIKRNPHIPPVVITAFKIFGKDAKLEKAISETNEITLSFREHTFSFEFAALNYTSTAKNLYAYKMEGAYDDWIQLEHTRDITFTGLPHGNYIFRVKGSNNDGVWNTTGASIKIVITPPFWQTWWFKLLIFLALMGGIFLVYKLRVRQYKTQRKKLELEVDKRTAEIKEKHNELKKSNQELNETNTSKDKLLSVISHDVKNPLTVMLGNSEMLDDYFDKWDNTKKHFKIQAIRRSIIELVSLVENLLQWARSQSGALRAKPETINLEAIVKNTIKLCKINAKKKEIGLFFIVGKNLSVYADRDMTRTVVRNLVTNAIKFTEKGGTVTVECVDMGNHVDISVIDNGVGVSPENQEKLFKVGENYSTSGTAKEKGTGLGLILTAEFVEKNNGRIGYKSAGTKDDGSQKGSIFTFSLPTKKRITSTRYM